MSLILICSILLRLFAAIWAMVLWHRVRDWRLMLLAIVTLAMVLTPAELIVSTALATSDWSVSLGGDTSELAQLLVSCLVLVFVWSLVRKPELSQHRYEQDLRESETRFRTIFEQAAVGVAQLDSISGNFLSINRRYCEILGMAADDVLGKPWMELTHPRDLPGDLKNMERLRAGDIPDFSMERQLDRDDGSSVWINLTVSPMWHPGEEPSTHIAIVEDITERKKTEQALLDSKSLYADLYENAPEMMASIEPSTTNIVQCNQTLAKVLGRPQEQIIGRPVFDILSSESAELVRSRVLPEFIATGRVKSEELTLNCADGTTRDVILNATAVRDVDGAILFSRSVLRDVTDTKQAAEALRQSEELFRRLVETTPFGVRRNDLSGRITFANPAAGEIFACQPDEMVGRFIWDFAVDEHARDQMQEDFQRHLVDPKPVSRTFETKRRTCDGRIIDVNLDWTYDYGTDEKIMGLIVIVTDITSRKQAEQEKRQHREVLAHMTRLSTMGEMVAGIAHEVRQPLYAIANFATASSVSLRNFQQSGSIDEHWLKEMKAWNHGVQDASKRANEIIQRLREFARKGQGRREKIDISHLIRDSIELVAFEARQCQAMVETELADDLAVVADRVQCEQVLVNLLHNAYEALADSDAPRRVIVRARPSDSFVEVQIMDNGPGIPSDQNGKLFEAFYTTKPSAMGMGLAISQTIVEDHGGRLWGRANQDGGATFHFTLPIGVERVSLQVKDA